MEISFDSELMKNQKHANVMRPDQAFEVLQTSDGDSLFFSIGSDDVFYVTREVRDSDTGWHRKDLSSSLASHHSGDQVKAKLMTVAQNSRTEMIDVMLVITVVTKDSTNDFLYYALNQSNKVDAWNVDLAWNLAKYDDPDKARSTLSIADVQLLDLSGVSSTSSQACYVDIIRASGDPLQLLDRYSLQFGDKQLWQYHPLSIDLKAGSVVNYAGRRKSDQYPGFYTYGAILDEKELIYTPAINKFNPKIPPRSARLNLPDGSTSVTTITATDGTTHVLVAASQGIFIFTPDNQNDLATPVCIMPTQNTIIPDFLSGTSSLTASNSANRTVLWGINAQRDLFMLVCPTGQEGNPAAWSIPVPVLASVEGFAFYLNSHAATNVLFAHTSGDSIIQLKEDPTTLNWTQRDILLPPTAVNDIYEFNSYTSHVTVRNADGGPVPGAAISFTSSTSVIVFINSIYYVLGPNYKINISTDARGTITIVQAVDTFSAASYQLQLIGTKSPSILLDPMQNAMQRLSAVQSGDDLANAKMQTNDGTEKPLLPNDIDGDTRDAAAKSIVQLLDVKSKLPADGSVKPKSTQHSKALVNGNLATASHISWGVSFNESGMQYHEGQDALLKTGVRHDQKSGKFVSLSSGLGFSLDDITGSLVNALKNLLHEVESFTITAVNDVWQFAATIAGKVYSCVLDCVGQVVGVLEFVFNKIKVFIEEIIAWLGFLFNWKDIIRTHRVIKNLLRCGAHQAVDSLASIKQKIDNEFTNFEQAIDSWAGIPNSSGTLSSLQKQGVNVPGMDSPQSNWAMYHTTNGAYSAESSLPNDVLRKNLSDGPTGNLDNVIAAQLTTIEDLAGRVKDQVVDQIFSLNPVDIAKRLLAILADALLKFNQEILDALIDVVQQVTASLLEVFEATIDIPVISWLYHLITGDDLSFLDLISLVIAAPATIAFKAIVGRTPFPDDSTTDALINASSLSDIGKLIRRSGTPNKLLANNPNHTKLGVTLALSDDDNNRYSGLLEFVSVIGGGLTIAFNLSTTAAIANKFAGDTIRVLRAISTISYVAYCAPNFASIWDPTFDTSWYLQLNMGITCLSILKAALDNHGSVPEDPVELEAAEKKSAALDFVINGSWLVPACVAYAGSSEQDTDKSGLGANVCFDVSGIIAPLKLSKDPRVKLAVALLQQACNAGCCLASAVAMGQYWNKLPKEDRGN